MNADELNRRMLQIELSNLEQNIDMVSPEMVPSVNKRISEIVKELNKPLPAPGGNVVEEFRHLLNK